MAGTTERLSWVTHTVYGSRRRPKPPQPLNLLSRSPLQNLIDYVYYLPMDWRKLILDTCRIQVQVLSNTYLTQQYNKISTREFHAIDRSVALHIDLDTIVALLDCVVISPAMCSMLSYFVRAENTYFREEFLSEKWKSLDKEMSAALETRTYEQALDYSGLFTESSVGLHRQLSGVEIPSRLKTLFNSGLLSIRNHYSKASTLPIFPAYNRRKNIGYETQRRYYEFILGDTAFQLSPSTSNVTTLDLLRLYYVTGEKITGPLEIRQAWFFNDLKARTYYCMGGDAFWAGLYVQEIANRLSFILPSTHPFSRYTVTRAGPISSQEVLITYDYSSFTTTLAELYFFMFWLGNELRGVPVEILDVHSGLRTLDLGVLLLEYNRLVNVHQGFSAERFFPLMENQVFYQGRSGSLGVKGNIVFSMFLHGISLAGITGNPDRDCCVGDDALAGIMSTFIGMFISCVNSLGSIHEDKFSVIPRPDARYDSLSQSQFKFLKRPLNVGYQGEVLSGVLDFFPSIADAVFSEGDGIHTGGSFTYDRYTAVTTFIMQWGRFLRIQTSDSLLDILGDDSEVILRSIAFVYNKFGLPIEGSYPGAVSLELEDGTRRRIELFIPPVERDCLATPWMELLLLRFRGAVFSRPITMGGHTTPPIDIDVGDVFVCTASKVMSLLVDLEICTKEVLLEDLIFDDEFVERFMEELDAGHIDEKGTLCRFTCLRKPSWYLDVVLPYFPDLMYRDPLDNMSRVSSLFG